MPGRRTSSRRSRCRAVPPHPTARWDAPTLSRLRSARRSRLASRCGTRPAWRRPTSSWHRPDLRWRRWDGTNRCSTTSAIPSTPLTISSWPAVPSRKPPRSSSSICPWKPSTYARASPCRGPGCTAGRWRRNPRRAGRRWRRTCRATSSRVSSKRRTRVYGSAMPRTGKAHRQRSRRRSTSPWRWPRPGPRVSTRSPRSWWRRDGTPPTTTSGPPSATCPRCCPRPTPMRWHGRRSCAGGAASGRSRGASCRRDGKPPTCRKPRTGRAASSTRTGQAA